MRTSRHRQICVIKSTNQCRLHFSISNLILVYQAKVRIKLKFCPCWVRAQSSEDRIILFQKHQNISEKTKNTIAPGLPRWLSSLICEVCFRRRVKGSSGKSSRQFLMYIIFQLNDLLIERNIYKRS